MNSHKFDSNELKRSVLYSICAVTIFVSQFSARVVSAETEERDDEHLMKRDISKFEFKRVQKRDYDGVDISTKSSVDENIKIDGSTPTVAPLEKNTTTIVTVTKATTGPEVNEGDISEHDKSNCSHEMNNETKCTKPENDYVNSVLSEISNNKDMLFRTLYVTLGITGIVVVYFGVRAICLRQKRTKSRKYRIIAQNGDQRDLEMEPLGDGNDDDEDYTVFELNGRKK